MVIYSSLLLFLGVSLLCVLVLCAVCRGLWVEHRWSPGGGLPEDGSTEGVLALGLGPRQLVRAWLALLLEIKVVVVR